MLTVNWRPQAIADLIDIVDYIEQDNLQAAQRMESLIRTVALDLYPLPQKIIQYSTYNLLNKGLYSICRLSDFLGTPLYPSFPIAEPPKNGIDYAFEQSASLFKGLK